ncbi:ATP synthase subunit b 2 [Candidatus Liberibacter asiaticus]|nr:ATP synthase subunit b 2 [Candidatus Liberibacter asiaticus]KAE9511464.1 ATP synthase subunit b 2 [Candidatus Liberibacter asiaticus]KAE9511866.1 ATP synthase subunit b 2 [Candidatus Liberibacter asiaticus]KAE9512948.1 ATP synthase subunit b 2 [Candidatus Liberibacter asiaticus]KAE9514024.1 ATP synthase subunit b 2 [Candidatus Liberibacter asiaticus]
MMGENMASSSSSDFSSRFPPFDTSTFLSQFFWLAIIFGIFYWVTHRFILPRLSSIMEVRRNLISSDQEKMDSAKREVESMISSYEESLAIARAHAKEIIDKVVAAAEQNLEFQREVFEKDLLHKLSNAQNEIDDMQKKASQEVYSIVGEVTKDLVRKLGFSVSDADVQKILDRKRDGIDAF